MMRSMFSAVSGLRIHQTRMDVIAHNLANVNTHGYKASRTTFTDIFSQTLQSASRANENTGRGGQNPMQVGLGANISAIDRRMTQGAAMRTDVPLDLMLEGEGFFIVSDGAAPNQNNMFTRAGAFRIDPTTGWIVNEHGMRLMGWDIPDGYTVPMQILEPIVVGAEREFIPAVASTDVVVTGNLNAINFNPLSLPNMMMRFYDSLGTRWTVDATFTFSAGDPEAAPPVAAGWTVDFGTLMFPENNREAGVEHNIDPTTLQFNANGALTHVDGEEGVFTFAAGPIPDQADPASYFGLAGAGIVTIDFSDMTQFNRPSNPVSDNPLVGGGRRAGFLEGISVGPDGVIRGRYDNGQIIDLAQIPVAVFRNPAGLQSVGNNLFVETANSGPFDGRGRDVSLGGGSMLGGVLEMSNVDLAQEFTDMIITQRGFQSNSRIITVSDEMLQILNNL